MGCGLDRPDLCTRAIYSSSQLVPEPKRDASLLRIPYHEHNTLTI